MKWFKKYGLLIFYLLTVPFCIVLLLDHVEEGSHPLRIVLDAFAVLFFLIKSIEQINQLKRKI